MNGNTGWTTECGAVTDITSIRENTFKPLKDKPFRNNSSVSVNTDNAVTVIETEEDLPF